MGIFNMIIKNPTTILPYRIPIRLLSKPTRISRQFVRKPLILTSNKCIRVRPVHTNNCLNGQRMDKSDHLTRTSRNTREDGIHSLTVNNIRSISPTVKEIALKTMQNPPRFSFKAGQWADVFIPGLETVGGFSMTSSPQELATSSILRFAIKYSTHPPALWMHKSCKVGDEINIRVGGDFHLESDKLTEESKILLVAGGVGINPLCSIANYVQQRKKDGVMRNVRVCLLFSAKSEDELLYKELFENYAISDPSFHVQFFVTATATEGGNGKRNPPEENIQNKRIQMTDLVKAANWLTKSDLKPSSNADIAAFVCGPPGMIKRSRAITDISKQIHSLAKNLPLKKLPGSQFKSPYFASPTSITQWKAVFGHPLAVPWDEYPRIHGKVLNVVTYQMLNLTLKI